MNDSGCRACRDEKTLYDKTLARRLRSTSRRTTRAAASLVALGLVAASAAAALVPAQATPSTQAYGGFSIATTASPLKLEVFEPVIPIPTDPQFEMDFSYTRVLGDSGPTTTARASAMWPGPAVGEGLKTFGEQLGLPGALTDGGYPVQVNSAYPSDTTQAASEPFPGMVQRVDAGEKRTVAKAGYTPSGDLPEGNPDGTATSSPNPLTALQSGDLTALGTILTGSTTGNDENPVSTSPLGDLSLLIDFDGMTSVSSAQYDGDKIITTATSRLGELRLLMGLIKLDGINVVTRVTTSLDGGAKTSRTVDVGGMTIAGQKFSYGPDGFTAAGSTTPVPGLPATGTDLLKMLGISIEIPKPTVTTSGSSGQVDAEAVRITLDTKPLRSKLPSLPLDDLVSKLPDLQQGNILKGMLVSLNTIAPRLVLHLGYASASASAVPPIDFGSGGVSAATGGTTGTPGTAGTPGTVGQPSAGEVPPATSPATTPIQQVAAVPGLPALGTIPMLLVLAGLTLSGGIGWYLRRAGVILFGGAAACAHGLKAGIPDLRKV